MFKFKQFKILTVCLFILLFLILTACSDSSNINDGIPDNTEFNTGSYVFNVIWDDSPKQAVQERSFQTISDCGDIETVEAFMYDASNNTLSSGSWPCSAHQGTLLGIPAGTDRKVCVIGKDASGYVLYFGEEAGIQIIANQTLSSQSPIVAPAFLPPEISSAPENGVTINLSAANFRWGVVSNASEYRIIFSESNDLSSPVINQIITDVNFNPPGLAAGKTYYWSIYSLDSEGNSSVGTGIQRFTIDSDDANQSPTATINNPANNSTYTSGDNLTFSGTGSDPEDGTLIGSSLVWSSSIDGQIGTGESFSINSLSAGGHTIILTVTDQDGAAKTDSITISLSSDMVDSDGDGVADHQDACLNTPNSLAVLGNGCPIDVDFNNSLGMPFNLIPIDGAFTMGSPSSEPARGTDETEHQVTLTKEFYMQVTEVTQAQWEAVMGTNPSGFYGCPNCPVENVSWNDVQGFISALNNMGEGTYRLPTEAQWEYSARAGSTTTFANGDITEYGEMWLECNYDSSLNAMGWYCNNAGDKTHTVAQKDPNAWGLYDMHGNVAEWCQDWYGPYPSTIVQNPTGPSSGSERTMRGGCFFNRARGCRSADRQQQPPDEKGNTIGFRLVRDR